MITNTELVNKLSSDINRFQSICENIDLYNARNKAIRTILKTGIAVDYALPFILVAIITANMQSAKGNTPFLINQVTEKANVQTIDTSYGAHWENISYDYDYDDKLIEYSTGWTINDRCLWERTVTSYRLNKNVDLSDTQKILSMSKEEIESELVTTNVETIAKKNLEPQDEIYKEDGIIIINNYESDDIARTRTESSGENIGGTILWIVLSLSWGYNLRNIEKLFVKTYIRDKLREKMPKYRKINRDELETMKKILELKQENLKLITDADSMHVEDQITGSPQYTLKKTLRRCKNGK